MDLGCISQLTSRDHEPVCPRGNRRTKLTVKRTNLRQELLPSEMLLVHDAQVSNKERLLCIRLAIGSQLNCAHDSFSEVNVRVAVVHGRETSDVNFLDGVLLARVEMLLSRRENRVDESIGENLVLWRRKGRRAGNELVIKSGSAVRGKNLNLRHWNVASEGRLEI